MTGIRRIAVIDIGKTNAKLALVDLATRTEIALRRVPNRVATDGPYPHHDVEALWAFILDSLGAINREHPVDAISVTTHGATAALLDAAGELALPVLDYEFPGPDRTAHEYDRLRPGFTETGSPRLPGGLNLGAQLFWQQRTFPERFARAASIMMYPQYWSFRLTGIAAGEVTSLGCHTDLWNPDRGGYSTLVDAQGWRALMPPVRPANTALGPILPEIAARTGLSPETPVFTGIHDSNASLLPHLLARQPPFSVVSTGTWVVSMAIGGTVQELDPARDTLVNVNALGQPVPSARFMGGREYDRLTQGLREGWDEADVDAVLRGIFLLPSVQQGSGPFPARASGWIGDPTDAQRHVAIAFYLAMMNATCLDLIGAGGVTIVEGPLAANRLYVAMLAAATGRLVQAGDGDATGTSIGAALLAAGNTPPVIEAGTPTGAEPGQPWTDYAHRWRAEVA